MTLQNRKVFKILVLVLSAALLTSCTPASVELKPTTVPTSIPAVTSSSPAVKPLESPAPELTPEPEIIKTTVVVIGADELRFENLSGDVLASFPYSAADAPAAAISNLTELYGKEAIVTYSGENTCWYHMNTYQWDNFKLDFQSETNDPTSSDSFFASTNTVNENYERVVQAPNGAQVSFPYSKFLKQDPELPHHESEYEGVLYGAMIGELTEFPYDALQENLAGVLITSKNDSVTAIFSPSHLESDC
jgi:hypothetical protein